MLRRCECNRSAWRSAFITFCAFLLISVVPVRAQDRTILFSPTAPGVTAAITNWGLDTCWPSYDNMQRGLIYMGTNNVTIVRVGFTVDSPLTNNDISPTDKSTLQTCADLASMATAAKKWDMNLLFPVDAWYQSGANQVYPDRWAAAMSACQRYYHKNLWMVEPFNEPDYSAWGEGSPQNLYDIMGYLQSSNNFTGTAMAGGSTLNDDNAGTWYDSIASRASIGTTHCLAGSASSYVSFIQNVIANGGMPFNPELHNVCEAVIGANYGLQGGIWWGTAERARGDFVKACQGKRLGYAEDLPNWTAAAVYRAPSGSVQAFFGGSERMAATTSYRLFSQDRDVFYDGHGPQRSYTVTVPGGTGYQVNQPNMERVVNVNWGSDIQPPIGGRFIIVNRNSHLALEVPGANANNGVILDQAVYTGALNQQWDIQPVPDNFGGDVSYFSITAAQDGLTADESGFSYANGNPIQQWNGGTNEVEQWYFQYVGNGYFKIRSRWSDKVIGVSGGSASSGAQIVQWDDTGALDQQWRLIPATVSTYDFIPPAPPTGVKATVNAVSVRLQWNQNSESDLASYTVLRSTHSGGPYDIVARGLTNNAYTDNSANLPQNYYYVVKAVDKSLNRSGNSTQVVAKPTEVPALVADYAFDGNMSDSSVNANNPIVTDGSPTFAGSPYGFALNLDGTNQYLMLPANMLAGVANFTIAVWVNWAGGNAWQRIFDFGNGTTQYMFLTPDSGNGTLRFAITANGNGTEEQLNAAPLPAGEWVHVAVTYDGSTAKLYTNGVLAASGAVTIAPASIHSALNYLGKSQFDADPLFKGQLDDLFIYNYALSDAGVQALASMTPYPPVKLTGTIIGSTGSWGGLGNSITNAFDGDTNTYYDAANASGDWVGLDLGTNQVIAQIKYCPRAGFASRMVGGVFQGANIANFSSGVVTLFTVTDTPPEGVMTSQPITGIHSFRYVRYLGPASGYCNVAELEFDQAGTPNRSAAPGRLVATSGNAQVKLSWSAVAGATSYNVKRSVINGGPYTNIASIITTDYTDTGLVNGSAYYYVLSSLGAGGEGANSTQVIARPVSTAPMSVTNIFSQDGLRLTWPSDHTGWRLQVQTNALNTGLSTNWVDVPGSTSTNNMTLPVETSKASVFYRLVYP